MTPANPRGAPPELEPRLSSLAGVDSVDLSGFPDLVVVRCAAEGLADLATGVVRDLVRRETGANVRVRVEVASLPPGSRLPRRARFDSIEVTQPRPGFVKAKAVLEWQKERHVGEAEEEASPIAELRACANATVRAVEAVAGGRVTFTLIGAKEVHVFDHDLVAVLFHSSELPEHRLIGTSIIVDDRRRSAALAALSATNRAVGAFLD